MKQINKKNKTIGLITLGLFVLVGAYNAVVINSDSHLSHAEVKFNKRLDEVYGIKENGRKVASSVTWTKLASPKAQNAKLTETKTASTRVEEVQTYDLIPSAAIQEELSMNLVEVINPKKWSNATQFNGTLSTNNGVIEGLTASLPGGESLNVSFSELVGNVFEYDLNGEMFSGMLYQVDQGSYMVTLTTGPLEGTRLRFSTTSLEQTQEDTQASLAENNQIEVGTFGQNNAPEMMAQSEISETSAAQTFTF